MPMPTLTPEQRAAIEAKLAEAQNAQHQLFLGQNVQQFRDQNGETVTYTPASKDQLASYIGSLQQQLGLTPTRSRGPLRVFGGR